MEKLLNDNINYTALIEILDCNNLLEDPEFKNYAFLNRSQKEIKEKVKEIIKNL